MRTTQLYQEGKSGQYVEALLKCKEKKVCTNLANTMDVSHDSMYRVFENPIDSVEDIRNKIKVLAQTNLNSEEIYLIVDDTHIAKMHAKQIEGVEMGYSGSLGAPAMGIKMMTALLTDGNIKIPIDTIPFVSRELAQSSYKTKSDMAIDIFHRVIQFFKIKLFLGDAHFATQQVITTLSAEKQAFLMKIPRNRKVTINGVTGQLQKILRLKRNSRIFAVRGLFGGVVCYFYVAKIENGTTIYFVSSDFIDYEKIIAMFRMRWNIELFHRTGKQSLGLGDCQMRALEKQELHALFVMYAYSIASVLASRMRLASVEDALRLLRNAKIDVRPLLDLALGDNLC